MKELNRKNISTLPEAVHRFGWKDFRLPKEKDFPRTIHSSPSIVQIDNKILLATRKVRNQSGTLNLDWRSNFSSIALYWMYFEEEVVIPIREIMPEEVGTFLSVEDPRLNLVDDLIEVWAAAWFIRDSGQVVIRQVLVELNLQFDIVSVAISEDPTTGIYRVEKNWCPVVGSNQYVYCADTDFVVIDRKKAGKPVVHGVDRDLIDQAKSSQKTGIFSSNGLIWEYGEVHGGSQVLNVDGRNFAIFQSSVKVDYEDISEALYPQAYFVGAYEFERSPPHRITRSTPEPIFRGSYDDEVSCGSTAITFPSGALHRDGQILVSFGINDINSHIVSIPYEFFDRQMTPFDCKIAIQSNP
jgi:predicted GH43/DUF377 family glycosyl hydrolase